MIVCIEGGDCCGKATQSKILAERLNAKLFSFPNYSTPTGKAILDNLKSEWTCDHEGLDSSSPQQRGALNALVLQSLMLTNRMEMGAELAAAHRVGHVVLDRYDASAIVYGTLDGLDPAWIRATNAQLPVRPDLYLLLDAPVEEGFKRRPERRDRYEKDRGFLERVREEYLRLFADAQAQRAAGYHPARWVTIDGVGTIDEVAARIWTACVQAGA